MNFRDPVILLAFHSSQSLLSFPLEQRAPLALFIQDTQEELKLFVIKR